MCLVPTQSLSLNKSENLQESRVSQCDYIARCVHCNTRYAYIFYNTEAVSALDILMKSSRMLSQRSLPTSIANPNNNKQKLCNDFIAFLASKDLKWHADEVDSNGESFVKAVVGTLWYIDGQHQVFEERSCSIPNVFKSFTGYVVNQTNQLVLVYLCVTIPCIYHYAMSRVNLVYMILHTVFQFRIRIIAVC